MAQDPQRWLETGSGERYTDFIDGAGVFVRETPQGVTVEFDPTLGFFSGSHGDLTDDVQGAADQDNSGDTFIQDVTVDDHGHVTALTAATASGGGTNEQHIGYEQIDAGGKWAGL